MEDVRRLICALAMQSPLHGDQPQRLVDAARRAMSEADEGHRWWRPELLESEAAAQMGLTKGRRKKLGVLLAKPASKVIDEIRRWPGQVILYGDDAYPRRLDALAKPPAALHLRGSHKALAAPGMAVVGSRKIGVPAGRIGRAILASLGTAGPAIISGGALGADTLAHRCAVDSGMTTLAIMPCGVTRPSPRRNAGLFDEILASAGVLISEYPPGQKVRKYHFRRRNRLIAALSYGVFVLRAGEKSGTMLTVEAARDLDRPLAAIPGSPDEPLVAGCFNVIRQGGALIANGEDLKSWWAKVGPSDINLSGQRREGEKEPAEATDTEEKPVYRPPKCEILGAAIEISDPGGTFSVEALTRVTKKSAAQLQTVLLRHELSGRIEKIDGVERYRLRQA